MIHDHAHAKQLHIAKPIDAAAGRYGLRQQHRFIVHLGCQQSHWRESMYVLSELYAGTRNFACFWAHPSLTYWLCRHFSAASADRQPISPSSISAIIVCDQCQEIH